MTSDADSLIDQFNAALGKMPGGQHLSVQRRVVDLFLGISIAYSERQSAIFDRIVGCLIECSDHRAVFDLSRRLATVDNVPAQAMSRLAGHHDITIAAPVLDASSVLTDQCLTSIVKTKGHNHVYAIAGRKQISETVTDALIERGHLNSIRRAVENTGARFSELGFTKVVQMARHNTALCSALAGRKDLPPELRPFLRKAGA
jgi:uncharacterized protein (DUF2336 family)